MNREEVLHTAKNYICSDRQEQYGSPAVNFGEIANYWNRYLNITAITPTDVAVMMILVKIARISTGKTSDDNWIDIAGYAALGAEVSEAATGAPRE